MKEINPKTMEEAKNLICDILMQGDIRYLSWVEDEFSLSKFLIYKAIILYEIEIPKINLPNKEIQNIRGPQQTEKYISKYFLKKEGFKDSEIFIERSFQGGKIDVFAEKKDKRICVECCSCRITKVIDFLEKKNTELWVTERYPISKIFIFKRGQNWNKAFSIYKKKLKEKLRKIKSPYDTLMEEKTKPKTIKNPKNEKLHRS